jgi:AraC-like DNA-binding protein
MEGPARIIVSGNELPRGEEYYRLILIRRGLARAQREGEDVILRARSLLIVPPGLAVRFSDSAGAEFSRTAFRRSALDPELLGEAADGLFFMLGPSLRAIALGPGAFEEAEALFFRLEREGAQRRRGRELMQRLALAELLLVAYRAFSAGVEGGRAGPARFRIAEAESYIRERYAENLTLSGVAARFGFNPSYFSRLFSERTGVHVIEFINSIRIEKSCLFLRRSGLSVSEIAYSVGYNNLSHFNRTFRRIVGMGPREYRKRGEK